LQPGLGLDGIWFQSRLFSRSFLLVLEVATKADAMEPAIDAKRERAIPVLKPADGELIFLIHA
jgi:hypothetical protein